MTDLNHEHTYITCSQFNYICHQVDWVKWKKIMNGKIDFNAFITACSKLNVIDFGLSCNFKNCNATNIRLYKFSFLLGRRI